MNEEVEGYADVNATNETKDGLPPGRIVMAMLVKDPHPIGDIARFLLNTEALLKEITKATLKRKRATREIVWCIESLDRRDHDDGTFELVFQFQGVTRPSFEGLADRIADIYGTLAELSKEGDEA